MVAGYLESQLGQFRGVAGRYGDSLGNHLSIIARIVAREGAAAQFRPFTYLRQQDTYFSAWLVFAYE